MEVTVNLKVIGQHVQEARNRLGFTQSEIASRIGVSDSYLSRLETGAVKMSMHRLFTLAVCLQASPGHLLAGCCPEVASCTEQNISTDKKHLYALIEQASAPTLRVMCAVCDTLVDTLNSQE